MRNSICVMLATMCLALAVRTARGAERLDWDPARTWVFAVGILRWEHEDIWSPFPECQKDRRDGQLVEYFRDAGVPDEQIVYLADGQATKRRIDEQFHRILGQAQDGDLLVFYFCGHGYRDSESGQTWFANYDAGERNSSAWNVRSIVAAIENHFGGDRALLMADCCHSGALYDEVLRLHDSQIAYAAITSSYAHNLSTGNWTFSDFLLAGLSGDPRADLDGDGSVDLAELARYCELELAFDEGQKSMFVANREFPRNARLADTSGELVPGVGQRLEVIYDGSWYKAETIDADDDQWLIHYVNFDDSWDEWVDADRMRPYQPAQFAEGDQVEVHWDTDGQWYPARVLKGWYGLHLVRYDGFDESSDEWVGPRAIRLRSQ